MIRIVRVPVRVAPRTQDATSAMSAVCMCTSSVAGKLIAGGAIASARPAARSAAAAIRAHAVSGWRFAAPNRVNDSFTMTVSACSSRNGPASAIVCRSPEISAIATRWPRATSALIPLSPTRAPFSSTWEITCGL